MKIIVAGGGKVGYYLAQTLAARHKVSLIDRNVARCHQIAEELPGVLVIHGDASDVNTLAAAGGRDADVLAAVTGKDEDNLVICQLARTQLQIKRTILRASSPKNAAIFSHFEGATVSGTALIAHVVEEEFSTGDLRLLMTFRRGDMGLVEIGIDEEAPAAGKMVKDLKLPKDVTLVSVTRGDEVIAPRGDTRIQVGDAVIAMSAARSVKALRTVMAGADR